jgi:hypothetical protein
VAITPPNAPSDAERGQAVLRAAAWSMLLEPGDHSSYGWTHCLSLPQAVLAVAPFTRDPGRALAIAATYVVGFRTSLARRPLTAAFPHPDPRLSVPDSLDSSAETTAAMVWHSDPSATRDIVTELATRAAVHHDGHLVSTRSRVWKRRPTHASDSSSSARRRHSRVGGRAVPTGTTHSRRFDQELDRPVSVGRAASVRRRPARSVRPSGARVRRRVRPGCSGGRRLLEPGWHRRWRNTTQWRMTGAACGAP